MAETQAEEDQPLEPVVRRTSRFSAVWILPIVALLFGLWLAWQYYSARGPDVTVQFETAEGIVAGKT
ncbi:MAG TPA: hypothetical protein VGK72_04305, partial [Chthoniobacterales bacterium]